MLAMTCATTGGVMSKLKGFVAACALVLTVSALLAGVCAGSARAGGASEIAFVRSGDIWVMSADGSSARRLTTSAKREGDPAWSPDGRTIVFIREGGQGQVWLMNADGTNQRRVPFALNAQTMPGTDDPGTGRGISEVAWAPSGADITVCAGAWTFDIPGGIFNDQLYLVHPDGTSQRRIGPLIGGAYGGIIEGLSWRPDGSQVMLGQIFRQGGGRAVVYDVQSNEVSVPFPSEYGGRTMWNPAWSPDGNRVAACVGDPSDELRLRYVALIDLATGDERRLPTPTEADTQAAIHPTWAPDGTWLACAYYTYTGNGTQQIYLQSADGTQSRLLKADAGEPAWSPTTSSPMPTPTPTLKLSGLTSGAMRLGRSVTATGKVTPTSLAGSKVKLTVQRKRSARWVTLKSVARTISASGAYSWKYKPARRGAYRMRATIAKTAALAAATTKWRSFKVK
jgi:Tol biopolymer transport system component